MQVGDLVRHVDGDGYIGVVTCVDPEQIGDKNEVEVYWNDGYACNMSVWGLEVISASR
tara:strand:- start:822 stop:995 length:174 start_codon:yes stop_codon:yes gene_type:complete